MIQIALTAACVYVGLLLLLLACENSIIFIPSAHLWTTPGRMGVPGEDVFVTTSDGVKLHGWFLPAADPLATVLFFHGNAGNIADRLENGIELQRRRFSVFLLDYRGYGKSEGSPSEEGTYRDADAAYDYLMARPGVDRSRLVVFGRSLGAGPAVDLASRRPCGGLVIESAFQSTRALARGLFPYFLFTPFIPDRYRSIEKIDKVNTPVLVIHGPDDELIPFSHGRGLFAAAREPKRFFRLERAGHNDWYRLDPEPYFGAWSSFVREQVVR